MAVEGYAAIKQFLSLIRNVLYEPHHELCIQAIAMHMWVSYHACTELCIQAMAMHIYFTMHLYERSVRLWYAVSGLLNVIRMQKREVAD